MLPGIHSPVLQYTSGMKDTPTAPAVFDAHAWREAEARIVRARAERYAATGSAASEEALWAIECELRASTGHARARALDLEHHLQWRRLVDRINSATAR